MFEQLRRDEKPAFSYSLKDPSSYDLVSTGNLLTRLICSLCVSDSHFLQCLLYVSHAAGCERFCHWVLTEPLLYACCGSKW